MELESGDAFEGELEALDHALLRFRTEFAGELRLEWRAVRRLATDGAYDVRLTSGERLRGRFREPDAIEPLPASGPAAFALATEGGLVCLAREEIVAIERAGAFEGYVEAGYGCEADPRTTHAGWFRGGARSAGLRTFSWLDGYFAYGERGGRIARREAQFEGLLASAIGGRLVGTLAADILTDDLREIDVRGVGGAGLGLRFEPGPGRIVLADAGPAYIYEALEDGSDEAALALRVGARFDGRIAGPLAADVRLLALVSTETLDDILVRVAVGPRVELFESLYVVARVVYDHDAVLARRADGSRDETAIEAGVGWRF